VEAPAASLNRTAAQPGSSDQCGEAVCFVGHLLSPPELGAAALCHAGESAASAFPRKPENRKSRTELSGSIFVLHLTTTHIHCVETSTGSNKLYSCTTNFNQFLTVKSGVNAFFL